MICRVPGNPTIRKVRLIRSCIAMTAMVLSLLGNSPVHAADEEKYGSVEERRIYETLVEERDSLRKEREEIALRKLELKTLEEGVDKKLAELDEKLAELKKLQELIAGLLEKKSAEEIQKRKELAGIYAKMDPAKAAQAISGLDPQLAADLLANMKIKSAAKILDASTKQKATELSSTFSIIQLE